MTDSNTKDLQEDKENNTDHSQYVEYHAHELIKLIQIK